MGCYNANSRICSGPRDENRDPARRSSPVVHVFLKRPTGTDVHTRNCEPWREGTPSAHNLFRGHGCCWPIPIARRRYGISLGTPQMGVMNVREGDAS